MYGPGSIVHVYTEDQDLNDPMPCCGMTMKEVQASEGHLYSVKNHTTIDVLSLKGWVWCAGHNVKTEYVNVPGDMYPGMQNPVSIVNKGSALKAKLNCMVCGYPRSIAEDWCGGFGHCEGCHQPADKCACCAMCHDYPCKCGNHQESVPLQDIHGEYEGDGEGDDHPSLVPVNWKCKNCHQHVKVCACKGGPTNEYGDSGYLLRAASQCMPAPWIHRGQTVKLNPDAQWERAWPNIRSTERDPVQWAADFYLYQALASGGLNAQCGCTVPCDHSIRTMVAIEDPIALKEARHRLHVLTDEIDLVFREYIDMACGGEVRHHPSVGKEGVLHQSRTVAWAQWRDIRRVVGTQALLDMEALFLDYNDGGGGGIAGPRWANAARLLHSRLTGKLTKELFVDQTFSLVHNGGVFLNKLGWKCGDQLTDMQGVVLPAQAKDDYDTILDYASPEAAALWAEGWREINYCRIRAGVRPIPFTRSRGLLVCGICHLPSDVGHLTYQCEKRTSERIRDKKRASRYRRTPRLPNLSWDLKTVILYQAGIKLYRSGFHPSQLFNNQELLKLQFTIPEGKRYLSVSDGDYNFLRLPITKFKGQTWNVRDLIEIHGLTIEIRNEDGEEF